MTHSAFIDLTRGIYRSLLDRIEGLQLGIILFLVMMGDVRVYLCYFVLASSGSAIDDEYLEECLLINPRHAENSSGSPLSMGQRMCVRL